MPLPILGLFVFLAILAIAAIYSLTGAINSLVYQSKLWRALEEQRLRDNNEHRARMAETSDKLFNRLRPLDGGSNGSSDGSNSGNYPDYDSDGYRDPSDWWKRGEKPPGSE